MFFTRLIHTIVRQKYKFIFLQLLIVGILLTGCGKESADTSSDAAFDGKGYLKESTLVLTDMTLEEAGKKYQPEIVLDNYPTLSVPTYITRFDGVWFIVDCYHDRVIYSEELGLPIEDWKIMCGMATQPHTIASDGSVYLIDDTENNRVLIYEKTNGVFIPTQYFEGIGDRPHFSVYDEKTSTFYVWSSENGEMYLFRHTKDSSRMYLTEIRKVEQLSDLYVRSFTIIDDDIYFVSGVNEDHEPGHILKCDLGTFSLEQTYTVPDELAGMVQIMPIDDMFYITISTDLTGNQDYATIVRTYSLDDLSAGEYEDIYSDYFIGGGTPYYISQVDDTYYLTEHRLPGHSIWSFKTKNREITEVTALY